jgi:hypothetical protein
MRAIRRILFPVGPLEVTSLAPCGPLGGNTCVLISRRIAFLNHAYELCKACRNLRVSKNLKTLRTHAQRPAKAADGPTCGEVGCCSHNAG